jgi:hypothetical protein
VIVKKRVYYVDQQGQLYNDMPPGKSGS